MPGNQPVSNSTPIKVTPQFLLSAVLLQEETQSFFAFRFRFILRGAISGQRELRHPHDPNVFSFLGPSPEHYGVPKQILPTYETSSIDFPAPGMRSYADPLSGDLIIAHQASRCQKPPAELPASHVIILLHIHNLPPISPNPPNQRPNRPPGRRREARPPRCWEPSEAGFSRFVDYQD